MADVTAAFVTAALVATAGAEIAKAKSIRERLETHGPRMGRDAIEILNTIAFAHEGAARQLIEDAQDQG